MRWIVRIGIICHVASTAALASPRIEASVKPADGGVWLGEIAVDGNTVLRLRDANKTTVHVRAQEVAGRLRRAAFQGIRPADVAVVPTRTGADLTIKRQRLLSIDRPLAQLSGLPAPSLAAAWAKRLQERFAKTYLMLEPDHLLVPYAEVRTSGIGGTATGPITCGLYADDVLHVEPTSNGSRLAVRGLGVGATVILAQRGGCSAIVTVDVKKWAAAIAPSAQAIITGAAADNPVLGRAVANAALSAVRPEGDAALRVGLPVPAGRQDAFAVPVEASGPGYIPTKRKVQVHVVNSAPLLAAVTGLLVSNDPELILAPGVLMVGELPAWQAVRLLYHHKNGTSRPCRFAVALDNVSSEPARVHVAEAAAGPHGDELFVGHAATRRFADRVRRDQGYVAHVPPGRRVEIETHMLGPADVTSGLARFANLSATAVRISVTAGGSGAGTGYFPLVPLEVRSAPDGGDRCFQPEKQIAASYTVGGAWLFLDIGREAVADARGSKLHGNYGVWYSIKLQASNPREESARLEIAVRAGGGAAWGAFTIDGHTVETPLLSAGQEQLLTTMTLAPRATRTVAIRTMPEAASSYPVTLIARSR